MTYVPSVSEEIVVAIASADQKVIAHGHDTLFHPYVATHATAASTTPVCVNSAFLV
jgi:hypothetical protein